MNTINLCVAQQTKAGQNPVAPLIEDIEILSKEQQKANLKPQQTDQSDADPERLVQMQKQHQFEIQ